MFRWIRSRRAGFRFLLVVVILFLLFHGVRYAIRQSSKAELQEIVDRLDATDPSWRSAHLAHLDSDHEQLPDNQNAALLVPKLRIALQGAQLDRLPNADRITRPYEPPNRWLNAEQLGNINRTLGEVPAALALARSYKNFSRGSWRVDPSKVSIDEQLADQSAILFVYLLLDADAERSLSAGQTTEALQLVRTMLNVATSLHGNHDFDSLGLQMGNESAAVRRIERILGLTSPLDGLAETQRILLQHADTGVPSPYIRIHRAFIYQGLEDVRAGKISYPDLENSKLGGEIRFEPYPVGAWTVAYFLDPCLVKEQADCLDRATKLCAILDRPDHEQWQVLRPLRPIHASRPDMLIYLADDVHSQYWDYLTFNIRTRAELRCAAVGIAVERFRQTFERWPDRLEEIPKGILTSVPTDPFDGKPLKYARRADGVTVYSIGSDDVDDGGTIEIEESKWNNKGDVGFRLYDPSHRGLPWLQPQRKQQ